MLKNTTKTKNLSKIRTLRKRKGLTLEDLSGITGISVSYLSRIEAKSRRLNSDTLGRISAALDCHPAELLDDVLSQQREDSPFRSMNHTAYSGALWKNINEGNPTILDQTMAQFYPMIMGMTNESRAALLRYALTLLISQISKSQAGGVAEANDKFQESKGEYNQSTSSPLSVLQELPVYRQTSASGDQDLTIDFTNPVRWISRPPELIGISTAFALEVSDHSLAPKYRPGDIILVNPNRSVSPGCSSIIMKKDNHILVKEYVQTKEDKVFLKEFSMNPEDVSADKNFLEIANDDLQNMYRIIGTIENAA